MADINRGEHSYVLRYFDIQGCCETIRLLLTAAKVKWTEEHPDWPLEKANQPYGLLPVLLRKDASGEVDLTISESQVIERYVARKYGLLPSDPEQAAIQEEIRDKYMDVWRYHIQHITATGTRKGDVAKIYESQARKLVEVHSELLKKNGSNGHFFGDATSFADLAAYAFLKFFRCESSRALEKELHIFSPENAPELNKLYETIEADPILELYFDAEKETGVRGLTLI